MKPTISIDKSGPSGNIFFIVGKAAEALRKSGEDVSKGEEMKERVTSSGSYEEACEIVEEYVTIEWE